MELQDYLRMIRRGWAVILLTAISGVALASLYVAFQPKTFVATTSLYVTSRAPVTIDDLEAASNFSTKAVPTYAGVIDSAAVLGPVSTELRPPRDPDELATSVVAQAREETTLIDITASGSDAADTAVVANAVAAGASRIVPELEVGPNGRPLIRVQQTRPSITPVTAVSPNVKETVAIGLVVGLSLGLGGTIARQSLDTRIRRGDELRTLTDLPLLGVLPHIKEERTFGLLANKSRFAALGEAFRALRTNLTSVEAWAHRSLVITSVADDEDGPFVAANLAWTIAQAERRVLLVDLDMRTAALAGVMGIDGAVGLADVLLGRIEVAKAVQPIRQESLFVLPAGRPQTSPADLLSISAMSTVLRRLEAEFDYVVLHAPPLLAFADAAAVSVAAGGTILTVASGRTKAPELTTGLTVLANVRVRPLGIVLSGARGADDSMRFMAPEVPEPRHQASLESPTLRQRAVQPSPKPGSASGYGRSFPTAPPRTG